MKVIDGGVSAPAGFKAAGGKGGIRKSGKKDIALIFSERICNTAAVFTTNRLKAASVLVTSSHLKQTGGRLHGAVINSGNANALTGKQGLTDARKMASAAAKMLGVKRNAMAVCSTGIIGEMLPMEKVMNGIAQTVHLLSDSISAGTQAAEAILTTDTTRKEFAVSLSLSDGRRVTIGGMTKGSGMISPKMAGLHATTLTFITTDAPVGRRYLQRCLEKYTEQTFNMISVDGDQSTNDTILLFSNGAAGGPELKKDVKFEEGLKRVLWELARKIALDGEGETKLLTVRVEGARNDRDASLAALSIVKSNLVKSAVFGGDPNVGRIASAIGNSGCAADFSKLEVCVGPRADVKIISNGLVTDQKKAAASFMKGREVALTVRLNGGKGSATSMGCDLTYGYVRINSAYTT